MGGIYYDHPFLLPLIKIQALYIIIRFYLTPHLSF